MKGSRALPMIVGLVVFACVAIVTSSPHSHRNSPSREREEDGAYPPRDRDHYHGDQHQAEFDHEAILGSRDAAEEFDHLTPEEAKKRLRILAEKMDKNKDGVINRKELTDWVLQSFRMLTEEEAEERMEEVDENEDGKVTWEEHLAETFGIYDKDDLFVEPDEAAEEQRMLKEDEELFKAADTNGDGILDRSEFPLFSHPEEFEVMHEVLYRQTMSKRDKDGDGYLSLEEYMTDSNGNLPAPGSEHYLVDKDHFENDYDLNKDGKLDKKEVILWLVPDNREVAENEADHLISSSDVDKDGQLSIQEIIDHHEIFVGSEATDFGEHLHNTHKFTDEL